MNYRCRECDAGLAHCHGALIVHGWQRPDCTEPDCTTPEIAHVYRLDCSAVGCACESDQLIGSAPWNAALRTGSSG